MSTSFTRPGELQTNTPLGLSWRLMEPVPAQVRQCVILLHGVGSVESHMAELADGMAPDALVVLVRGPLQLGPGQFAWFRVAFTANGPSINVAEAEHSRQALVHFVQQLQGLYGLSAENTVIAGFSQGGIMSASMALSTPESVAGFGLLSGRILPELAPHLASKQRLATLKAFVAHGEQDSTLPVTWALRADTLLNELGVSHELHLYPMAHSISAATHADFLTWLAALRTPQPQEPHHA
jgi:phospholipase/carboxylesterase